jgi:hypothetical protein
MCRRTGTATVMEGSRGAPLLKGGGIPRKQGLNLGETLRWGYFRRCVTLCLIGANVQHQGEADLFPGKGGELRTSIWQEA